MGKRRAAAVVVPPELLALADHAHAIDRLINEPIRLCIFLLLIGEDEVSFSTMKTQIGLSTSTLWPHLHKLEQAGYVEVLKAFEHRRAITRYRLTPVGYAAWDTFWSHMDPILDWLRVKTKLRPGLGDGERGN